MARRALKILGKPDYVVTDIVHSRPKSARRYDVVFVEQRWMGIPVFDGRRSVIVTRGKTRVTGRHLPVRSVAPVLPAIDAEAAVRAALRRSSREWTAGAIRTVSSSPGFDRYTVLSVKPLRSPVTAHLVVFGTGRARLAWVVTAELPSGHAREVVVDADSRKFLHARAMSHHAAACLGIAPEAGGPAAGAVPLKFTVDPQWLDPAARRIECLKPDGKPWPLPALDVNGDFCESADPFEQTTLDGLVIANLGLDRLLRAGGPAQARVTMTLIKTGKTEAGDVAMALPSRDKPELRFTFKSPSRRHAASDPSVVLHELAHLVLSRGVGGTQFASPFETTGESGAVMEGLADFLGLTLWNSIRRASLGGPDIEAFGQWLLDLDARDYSASIANPATAPTFPFSNASAAHRNGMVLCLALWLTRVDILSQFSLSADAADRAMWGAVCGSLPLMPHQGSCPHLCCASRALRGAIATQFQPALTLALANRHIPSNCTH